MEVRKFQGASIQEATSMVRKHLGSDALILSTRKVGKGKRAMAGLFEIQAIAGKKDHGGFVRDVPTDSPSYAAGGSDLTTMKELLFLLSGSGFSMNQLVESPGAMDLYIKMIKGGVSESNAQGFLKQGGAFEGQTAPEHLYEQVLKRMLEVVEVADLFENSKGQVVAALVGPTGVGKTTTIAKLVADLVLKQKRKVGLISIDNYRIGAMDQLKTYATILGVPCFPAFGRAELKSAMRQLNEKDVILIDTAGQSHYDMARMNELAGLLHSDRTISCHLLLSVSTNPSEMDVIARNFGKLNCSSYIFTKTDESRKRGAIINQVLKAKMPISYVTVGQRVPEDILKATKTGILNLVFE
jgi:flagellar biosynthesis protein FlhF